MLDGLEKYLKNTKKADFKKLEDIVKCSIIDPAGQLKKYEIKIRKNPVFNSRSRIAPEREKRKTETISLGFKTPPSMECFFCNPKKSCAKFDKESGLEEQYFLNDSVAFPNLFSFGNIHGVVVFNYKQHIKDARGLTIGNWADGIKLVQEVGKISNKKYVSMNVNSGFKAASSLEHFHGQFHCEDEPLAKTSQAMKLGNREYWKSWVKALLEIGLVIDFDKESKTVLYVEWAPSFGKTEFVVLNLENPSFKNMSEKEIKAVAKFLDKAIRITMNNVSDQFNIINLSASPKDDFCNQFRIFSRSPLENGIKSWEGYVEAMDETVPHIIPERLAEIVKISEKN